MTLDEIRSMMHYVARTRRPPHAIEDLLAEWAVCLWDISREDAYPALMSVMRQHHFWPRPQDVRRSADPSIIIESEALTAIRAEIERRRQLEAAEEEAVQAALRRMHDVGADVTRLRHPRDAEYHAALEAARAACREDEELVTRHIEHVSATDVMESRTQWEVWDAASHAASRAYMDARWREIEPHAKRLGIRKYF